MEALPPAAADPLALVLGELDALPDDIVPPAAALSEPLLIVLPVVDDCVVDAPWFIVEDELVSVELWFAETLLFTLWLPLPMFTPGLTLAPRLTSVLLMPTLASTPTFGLTFTPVLVEVEGELEPPAALGDWLPVCVLVDEDWLVDVPWLMVDVELVSVDDWLAVTLLDVLFEPLAPSLLTFTPGLMFAPAFTSLLPMPTFAPTPTFGLTLTLLSVLVCAKAVPNTPITAAAVRLTANFLAFMLSPFGGRTKGEPASPVPSQITLKRRG